MYYLLFGILLGAIGPNFVTGLAEIIATFSEYIKAKITIGIVKSNAIIEELNSQCKKENKLNQIGFITTLENEDEEDGE